MSARPARASWGEGAKAAAWFAGLVLTCLAIALPLLHEEVYVRGFRADLVEATDRILETQRAELIRKERFQPALAQTAVTDPRIAVRATVEDDGALKLLTMTAPGAVTSRWLPAIIYERRLGADGALSEGQWLTGG